MVKKTASIPPGIRRRNPGNIKYDPNTHFFGEQAPEDGFCTFDVAEHGIRACGVILLTYYRVHSIRTIREAITRWSDTNRDAYIAYVAKATKLGADTVLNFYDDPTLIKLVTAIIFYENGTNPYSPTQYKVALAEALAGTP